MVTGQSVTCQPWSPWRSVVAHRLLDRPEERRRHRAQLDLEPVLDPPPTAAGSTRRPDRGEERVGRRADDLGGRADADRPLDADRRRLAERHLDAVLAGQRRLR